MRSRGSFLPLGHIILFLFTLSLWTWGQSWFYPNSWWTNCFPSLCPCFICQIRQFCQLILYVLQLWCLESKWLNTYCCFWRKANLIKTATQMWISDHFFTTNLAKLFIAVVLPWKCVMDDDTQNKIRRKRLKTSGKCSPVSNGTLLIHEWMQKPWLSQET